MPTPIDPLSHSFARAVQNESGPVDRLQRGVELTAELVEGCDHAGVTLVSRRSVETAAFTGELARLGDLLQYELDEGPCLDTVRQQHTVISPDLATEVRWRRWAPRVRSDLGVNAMMSLLLYTERDTVGALNLYARNPDVWSDHSIAVAHALADQLAVAVADAREIEHRGRAMVNRTVIGQAEGILMERLSISVEQAFAFLRRVSQDSNRKLLTVAEELVRTRRLPDGSAAGGSGVGGSGVDGSASPSSGHAEPGRDPRP